MIPQYSKKQIISSYEEPLDTNVLWLDLQRDLEIKSPVLKYFNGEKWVDLSIFDYISHIELLDKNAELNFQHITQNQKDKLDNFENYIHPDKHPTSILEGIDTEQGDENTFLNKKGEFKKPSTDIISTNATNNTGTIVIDTTPNWQRVNINSGSNTLILDYENGVLPTKNREYLLVINNSHTYTKILTLPTDSIIKNGITYNFKNTAGSVPIEKNRSIEVNVIFFFIDATTCNIRTQISQFI